MTTKERFNARKITKSDMEQTELFVNEITITK